jgi:hypothetical protein
MQISLGSSRKLEIQKRMKFNLKMVYIGIDEKVTMLEGLDILM